MTTKEKYELIKQVSNLPIVEQLELIEELIRGLRKASLDRNAIERSLDKLVADPGMQRVLRNEDVVESNATG